MCVRKNLSNLRLNALWKWESRKKKKLPRRNFQARKGKKAESRGFICSKHRFPPAVCGTCWPGWFRFLTPVLKS